MLADNPEFNIDANGALVVDDPEVAVTLPLVTGDLTASGNTLVVDVTQASTIAVTVKNTGTAAMAAGTFAFEGSINSTNGTDGDWFFVALMREQGSQTDISLSPTPAAGTLFATAFKLSTVSLAWFRIRTTTAVTASSIARWTVSRTLRADPAFALTGTNGTGVQVVSGSGSFSITPAGGISYSLVSAATTNAQLILGSSCSMEELTVFNPTAALVYVKFYNKATAPTVGTDIPILTIPVAVNQVAAYSFGPLGKKFGTGLGIGITAGPLATDVAAVAAGVQVSLTRGT